MRSQERSPPANESIAERKLEICRNCEASVRDPPTKSGFSNSAKAQSANLSASVASKRTIVVIGSPLSVYVSRSQGTVFERR
jgi:hypothetical protein